MNNEMVSIVRELENINSGHPWYGRPVYKMLDEIDTAIVYKKPGKGSHSLIELLYHMITWADFTLKRIEKDKKYDLKESEKMDWREINPEIHTWKKGLAEFKSIHKKMIQLLNKKDDSFLEEKVDFRKYNFRFLIHGLIQHNIYHIGQVVYVKKLLE